MQRAARLADTHALRGYDAVQLAVALDVHARDQALVLVSADAERNAAATTEGLRVKIRIRIREPTVPGIGWPIPLTVHSACLILPGSKSTDNDQEGFQGT